MMAEMLESVFGAPVIGDLPASQALPTLRSGDNAVVIREIEDLISAADNGLTPESPLKDFALAARNPKPWQYTEHTFGFISLKEANSSRPIPLQHAGNIKADQTLKGARVTVALDRLRAVSYPGGGIHRVLFDFYGEHHVAGADPESLHFTQTFRIQEGQAAGITGYPVFVGLSVGKQGVSFKGFTVNVQNDDDHAILDFLDGDIFNKGLKLVTTANPAIAPLAGLAVGITKTLARRHDNVPVQDFYLGLDFTSVATRARIAEGSYVVAQVPHAGNWNWAAWTFNPMTGEITTNSGLEPIPYNYLVFSVSRYEE